MFELISGEKRTEKDVYQSLFSQYTARTDFLASQLRWLSVVRLLFFCSFLFLGYKAIVTTNHYFTIACIISLIIFLILLRKYDELQQKAAFYKALASINRQELSFLEGAASTYPGGEEYIDPHHPYSYDLDIFGEGGLFTYLNRTSTGFGRQALAQSLLRPEKKDIVPRQESIQELSSLLEFRQQVQAYGMIQVIKEEEVKQLKAWINSASFFRNKTLYYALLIFPLATFASLIYYFISEKEDVLNLFYGLFVVNLTIAFSFARKITAHLSVSASVTKVLQQFSRQLHLVESQSFQSPLLKKIQEGLKAGNLPASRSIAQLASLFNYLETIINLVVSIFLNGLFLFHVHILYALEKWKQRHGASVLDWLELLG